MTGSDVSSGRKRVFRLTAWFRQSGVVWFWKKDRSGGFEVNRINYEICILTALRERLRCKEIWVVGADRYRNPDEDLPGDFEERRADYYRELGCDPDAAAFVADLKAKMTKALRRLIAQMPTNPKVRILWRGKNRISISRSNH